MSAAEKVGRTKHKASPPLQKVGEMSLCPPTDLRPRSGTNNNTSRLLSGGSSSGRACRVTCRCEESVDTDEFNEFVSGRTD